MLLERLIVRERLRPDVADHGGVLHERGEAIEVHVVPRFEAQARRFDRVTNAVLGLAEGHTAYIGYFGGELYPGVRSYISHIPPRATASAHVVI